MYVTIKLLLLETSDESWIYKRPRPSVRTELILPHGYQCAL